MMDLCIISYYLIIDCTFILVAIYLWLNSMLRWQAIIILPHHEDLIYHCQFKMMIPSKCGIVILENDEQYSICFAMRATKN